MRVFLVLFLGFSSMAFSEQSLSVRADGETASHFSTLHIGASGDVETQKGWYFSGWDLSGGTTESEILNATTGEKTKVTSQDFLAAGYFKKNRNWTISFAGSGSLTEQTDFSQSTGDLDVEYAGYYNRRKSAETQEIYYASNWRFGVGTSLGSINQKLTFVVLSQNVERDMDLKAYQTRAWLGWSPNLYLSFKLKGSTYWYSHTKKEIQRFFQSRFVSYNGNELVSSISGLQESSVSFSITYNFSDTWDVVLVGKQTKEIVDSSYLKKSEVTFTRYFDNWAMNLGYASQSEPATDSSVLFGVGYNWD